MPTWEEDLFVLEPLAHIVSVGTMLIFEVADSQNEEVIAWAFLKPVAANGALNAGKTLRLQLYKPGKQIKDKSIPQVIYKKKLNFIFVFIVLSLENRLLFRPFKLNIIYAGFPMVVSSKVH